MNFLSTRPQSKVLNSWKEISSYLGRGIRTVQRWEVELNLPVHRVGAGSRSPVFAFEHELRFWLHTTRVRNVPVEPAVSQAAEGRMLRSATLAKSRLLMRQLMAKTRDNRRLLESVTDNLSKMHQVRGSLNKSGGSPLTVPRGETRLPEPTRATLQIVPRPMSRP